MSDPSPPTPKGDTAPEHAAPAPRTRRRRCALLIAASAVFLLWLAITQSGVLARFVVPMIRAELPCDVACGRVTMDPLGRVRIRNVKLTVPALSGPASEFLTAPSVTVKLDWGSVFSGAPRIGMIELHAPVTRLSVAPDQTLNVASLRKSGAGPPKELPQIVLTRAKFELGEHNPASGDYDELFTLRVEGETRAHPNTANLCAINLSEILPREERAHRTPTSIDGWIDLSKIEGALTVHDVDLASWSERAAPRAVRDLWEQMAMRGRIDSARFAFSSQELREASFTLENVEMRIPVQRELESGDPPDAARELVSMTGVSGTLRFDPKGFQSDLAGQIEDLACHVTIRTDGLALDAPLVCNIRAADFIVAEHPQLMPFAPPYVERIFRRFSGPTAEVSGVIRVERGEPVEGAAAPLDVAGAFTFEHGQASYEYFPYPFHNMRGTINFDAESIDIVHISARGPSGSSLLASGWITPPREGAAVELDITVADALTDEDFYAAMPPKRAQVLDAIFYKPAYEQLLAQGLVQTQEQYDALEEQHREAERQFRMLDHSDPATFDSADALVLQQAALKWQLATPVFDLGGRAALFIKVLREFGMETDYETSIGIHLDNAGIIPEAFPYPVRADEIRIQINDTTAHISAPSLVGPTGADASLVGSVIYAGTSTDYEPSLDIRASAVPVDQLIFNALPAPDEGDADPREILARLALDGTIDCTAEIRPDPAADQDVTYSINLAPASLRAQPKGAPIPLTEISGRVNIKPDRIAFSGMSAHLADAQLAFDCTIGLASEDEFSLAITADRLDLVSPIEQIAGAFVPTLHDSIASLRSEYAPEGTLDAVVSINGDPQDPDYTVRFSNLTNTSFTSSLGRTTLTETTGGILFEPRAITFDDFTAQLALDFAPAGFITLRGAWQTEGTSEHAQLTATLDGTSFDAPVIRSIIDDAGPAAQEWIARHNPRGIISVQADIESIANEISAISSRVSPRSLTIDLDGQTLDFPAAAGWLTLVDTGAQFDNLLLAADEWSTTINGTIEIAPEPAADLKIDLEARGLPESLTGVLPAEVNEALAAIELDVQGVLTIEDATLEVSGRDTERSTHFFADLAYSGASIDAGVEIDQLSGVAHLDITAGPDPEANRFEAVIVADTLRAFSVEMTDAHATVSRENESAPFRIRDAYATAHDGHITANALVAFSPSDADGRYRVDVEAIDVDLASLLEQVNPDDKLESEEATGKRGRLDLSIAIEGTAGEPDSRRGRGLARVQGGDLLGVPGAMPLIRLSNLQLPFGEPLSFAYADFHIEADTVQVTDMQLFSESIAVVGAGTLALQDMGLDLRFHSRGQNRVPIVSDLIEGMRDEFITAVVRGTLRDPEFTYEQFAGTRKMLDAIFSSRPTQQRTVRAQEDNEP